MCTLVELKQIIINNNKPKTPLIFQQILLLLLTTTTTLTYVSLLHSIYDYHLLFATYCLASFILTYVKLLHVNFPQLEIMFKYIYLTNVNVYTYNLSPTLNYIYSIEYKYANVTNIHVISVCLQV